MVRRLARFDFRVGRVLASREIDLSPPPCPASSPPPPPLKTRLRHKSRRRVLKITKTTKRRVVLFAQHLRFLEVHFSPGRTASDIRFLSFLTKGKREMLMTKCPRHHFKCAISIPRTRYRVFFETYSSKIAVTCKNSSAIGQIFWEFQRTLQIARARCSRRSNFSPSAEK